MGFNQFSSSASDFKVAKPNLFGDVISGCLAGFGIWTKPSPAAKLDVSRSEVTPTNVYPLRVVRVKEVNPQLAGRMVISGRMADVCAELDRLAA
jgi:hypothetical protein